MFRHIYADLDRFDGTVIVGIAFDNEWQVIFPKPPSLTNGVLGEHALPKPTLPQRAKGVWLPAG